MDSFPKQRYRMSSVHHLSQRAATHEWFPAIMCGLIKHQYVQLGYHFTIWPTYAGTNFTPEERRRKR